MLAIYIENRPLVWDKHLPLDNAAYNSSVSSSTGFTPKKLLFGRELNSIIEAQLPRPPTETPTPSCPILYIQWLQSSLHSCQQAARDNIDRAYTQQNRYADHKVHDNIQPFSSFGTFINPLTLSWTLRGQDRSLSLTCYHPIRHRYRKTPSLNHKLSIQTN